MPRVIGIDPGTVSIDLCGLDDSGIWLDQSLPTRDALRDPAGFLRLLSRSGTPDLIAGPSGYGLPLVRADQATEDDLHLALLAPDGAAGGIGGLRRLARMFADSALPVVYTPGVIHLPSVPSHRKLNRIDLGTADKVAATALAIREQARRLAIQPGETSLILLELGGAFTAGVAVAGGAIVDGIGGTSGPIGWQSGGGWDGEVACLAGRVSKEMLFRGGAVEWGEAGVRAYVEGALKMALALTAAVPEPREILLSGRHAADAAVRDSLQPRLADLAPVRDLRGEATVAKQGAEGAAILADGLAGGRHRDIVDAMRIREAGGTVLDHLRTISPEAARRQLGG